MLKNMKEMKNMKKHRECDGDHISSLAASVAKREDNPQPESEPACHHPEPGPAEQQPDPDPPDETEKAPDNFPKPAQNSEPKASSEPKTHECHED